MCKLSDSVLVLYYFDITSENLWHGVLVFVSDSVSALLCSALLCSALFGLVPTSLSLSAPTLETKWFYCGLSCVHTRGSEKNKGKISPLSLPCLATGVSTTLPMGVKHGLCSV